MCSVISWSHQINFSEKRREVYVCWGGEEGEEVEWMGMIPNPISRQLKCKSLTPNEFIDTCVVSFRKLMATTSSWTSETISSLIGCFSVSHIAIVHAFFSKQGCVFRNEKWLQRPFNFNFEYWTNGYLM